MCGAYLSGRLAGKMPRGRQIRIGFTIMFSIAVVNLVANGLFTAQAWWAIPPIGIFSFGWALMVPVVTLLVLDQAPLRRGMASSLQACIGSVANAFVAGVISPLVMHSTVLLALASLLMSCIGIVAWFFVHKSVLGAESDAKLA
jgi:DHA1 family bicyclomycin/chloramphenicol resistance-like MFS transporter